METKALTPAQQRAISALLSARHIVDAAIASGVAERTLKRWLLDTTFRAALQTASSAALATTIRRMTSATSQALDVLVDVMTDGENDSVKLRASLGVLSLLPSLATFGELEARVAALEQAKHDAG